MLDAPPDAIAGGYPGAGALIALAAIAAACAVSSSLVAERHTHAPRVLDSLGMAVFAYLTVVALDGIALTLALTAEAVLLALIARRGTRRGRRLRGELSVVASSARRVTCS